MKTKTFQYFSIFLFVSVLFFSCKKEEAPLASLNFQVEEIDGVYHCSWTATNISIFQNYYIVHSPFLMGEDDEPSGGFSKRWTQLDSQAINNQSITIENEDNLTLRFQLFVDIGERMIRSETIVFEKENSEVIDIIPDFSILLQESNTLYFYRDFSNYLVRYNFLEKKIEAERKLPFEANKDLIIGNNGFGEELYIVEDEMLFILDANRLETKTSFEASGTIHSLATNDDGLIVITLRDVSNKIQVITRDGMNILNSLTSSNNVYFPRKVVFISKENNEFIEVDNAYFKYFKVDDNGIVLEEEEIESPFSNNNNAASQIISSPFDNYFAMNDNGQVFNSSLENLAELSTFFGDTYSSFWFDKDETALYAFLNPVQAEQKYVDKFSIPDFDFVERKGDDNLVLNWFYKNDELYSAYYSDYFKCIFIKPVN